MAGSINRRQLLQAGGALLGAGALATALPSGAAAVEGGIRPYYPKGGRFTRLHVIDDQQVSGAESVMVGTLQGLAARSSTHPHVYVNSPNSPTDLWLGDLQDHYGVTATPVTSAWDLLARYPSITGYVLYDVADGTSVAVATNLAGILGAVAVDVSIQDKAVAAGLSKRADARGKDDAWMLANLWPALRHDFAVEQKPSFGVQLRDLATMARAPLFYSGNSATRDQLIHALDADSPVIGWGDASNGEDKFVSPDSHAGVFELACDWGRNLSTLSGVRIERLRQRTRTSTAPAEPNVHYVTFAVTDGDNAQWLLTSLPYDKNWWASPLRGTVPLGWGIPPTLLDLAPSAMRWYYGDASGGANPDEFIVGPSGSGYMYPSQYPDDRLTVHTGRLDSYLHRTDLSVVQILDFGALDKVSVWDRYTARSGVAGLFYLEYSRYDGEQGRVVWSNGKPVVSARHMLWDGLSGADETTVTNAINAAPRDPTSTAGYTFVTVHAWSKTLANIRAVVDNLASDVRVVTPTTFTHLLANNVRR
jgi:hypothetical protein